MCRLSQYVKRQVDCTRKLALVCQCLEVGRQERGVLCIRLMECDDVLSDDAKLLGMVSTGWHRLHRSLSRHAPVACVSAVQCGPAANASKGCSILQMAPMFRDCPVRLHHCGFVTVVSSTRVLPAVGTARWWWPAVTFSLTKGWCWKLLIVIVGALSTGLVSQVLSPVCCQADQQGLGTCVILGLVSSNVMFTGDLGVELLGATGFAW
jgi:hypothetical protein